VRYDTIKQSGNEKLTKCTHAPVVAHAVVLSSVPRGFGLRLMQEMFGSSPSFVERGWYALMLSSPTTILDARMLALRCALYASTAPRNMPHGSPSTAAVL